MKEISSSEFRKTYGTLTEPTVVTALGRPIGTYVPISTNIDLRFLDGSRPGEPASTMLSTASGDSIGIDVPRAVTVSTSNRVRPSDVSTFGAPQAAPKPGGKKR